MAARCRACIRIRSCQIALYNGLRLQLADLLVRVTQHFPENHSLIASPSQPDIFLARSGPEVVPSLPTRSGRSIAWQNFAQSPSVATISPTYPSLQWNGPHGAI